MENNENDTMTRGLPERLIYLFLTAVTALVYMQVRTHTFLNYDDGMYVTGNPFVLNGLNRIDILWAFSNTYSGNWHPLTWISHMLDVELYGLNAGAHHITNVLIHTINTLLLYSILKKITQKIWLCGLVAVLFAIHPLHVESVAWISERKDVLSAFFFMLVLFFYVRYTEKETFQRYLIVVLFFIFGMLSKPMLVTLPFLLVLLDYWPLNRIKLPYGNEGSGAAVTGIKKKSLTAILIEKIPLFVLSFAGSVIAVFAQHSQGAIGSTQKYHLYYRVMNSLLSYVAYIRKLILPTDLAAFYPYEHHSMGWQVLFAGVLLILITILAMMYIRRKPWFFVGWFWFIGTLIPVIGILRVGLQSMADRYTYIPAIGIFIIFSWGIGDIFGGQKERKIKVLIVTGILFMIGILGFVSYSQIGTWKNSMTLYGHALRVTRNNFLAHRGIGSVHLNAGRLKEASTHYLKALRIKPDYAFAHFDMGRTMFLLGEKDSAYEQFYEALKIKPEYADVFIYMGYLELDKGEYQRAADYFTKAIYVKTPRASAYHGLGRAMAGQEKYDAAIRSYQNALRLNPYYVEAYNDLGITAAKTGDFKKALMLFRKALVLNPNYQEAAVNMRITKNKLQKK